MIAPSHIDTLDPAQLRRALHSLMAEVVLKDELIKRQERESVFKQAIIDKLTHEMAALKRLKFAAKSEAFNAEQKSLIEETIDADLAALAKVLESLRREKNATERKQQPRREKLLANLPRREVHHEPENATGACGCALKRTGEGVAEKLDYAPEVFTVEHHVRGKWVCTHCQTLVQVPVALHIIDKGIPRPGCWPRCWWPSSSITCRCTSRNTCSSAPVWPSRVRPWRSGWASAAPRCSRWYPHSKRVVSAN